MEEDSTFEWFWKKLDGHLESKQLKQTKQRKVIVRKFLELNSHVKAEDLYSHLKQTHPNIGLATVYRTLNLLKEARLVDQKMFADGRTIFEVLTPGSHHDHLLCLECDNVVEFKDEIIEARQEALAAEFGFTLVNHNHDLYGICRSCNEKNAGN